MLHGCVMLCATTCLCATITMPSCCAARLKYLTYCSVFCVCCVLTWLCHAGTLLLGVAVWAAVGTATHTFLPKQCRTHCRDASLRCVQARHTPRSFRERVFIFRGALRGGGDEKLHEEHSERTVTEGNERDEEVCVCVFVC